MSIQWQVFLIYADMQGPSGEPLRHVGIQGLSGEEKPSSSHHLFFLAVVKVCGLVALWETYIILGLALPSKLG